MFRFTRKPSSESHSQYLARITHLVQRGYVELVQDFVSVMAAYCDLWGVCAVHTRLTGQLRLYADDVSVLGENTISVMYSEVRRAVGVEESMGEYVQTRI